MSLSKREIGLLGLLVLTGIIYLLAHFLFQPLITQQQQLQAENSQLAREWEGMEARLAPTGDNAWEGPEKQAAYQQMVASVPPAPMIPETIDFLELSAQEAHVKLLSIGYKEGAEPSPSVYSSELPAAGADTRPINFKITVNGTHFNLLSWLLKIENAPRLYVINGIKMTRSKTDEARAERGVTQSSPAAGSDPKSASAGPQPESLQFDPNLSILELDFNAFYECSPSNISA